MGRTGASMRAYVRTHANIRKHTCNMRMHTHVTCASLSLSLCIYIYYIIYRERYKILSEYPTPPNSPKPPPNSTCDRAEASAIQLVMPI